MEQNKQRVHVVAAVIKQDENLLIAKRPLHLHQGGKWEFPGGKVEAGEKIAVALARELKEELDIEPLCIEPLIQVAHDYPDKSILLDVWLVSQFCGQPVGVEGQELRWVKPDELMNYTFPAANVPIVAAARLPRTYVITPELNGTVADFVQQLERLYFAGHCCLQIRTKSISKSRWCELLSGLDRLKERLPGLLMMMNSELRDLSDGAVPACFAGVHYSSKDLSALAISSEEAQKPRQWRAASCHNLQEVQRAQDLGIDFVTLSPFNQTLSHPDNPPIEREQFVACLSQARLPVYALGGVTVDDLPLVVSLGAQGVAGIRGFWTV